MFVCDQMMQKKSWLGSMRWNPASLPAKKQNGGHSEPKKFKVFKKWSYRAHLKDNFKLIQNQNTTRVWKSTRFKIFSHKRQKQWPIIHIIYKFWLNFNPIFLLFKNCKEIQLSIYGYKNDRIITNAEEMVILYLNTLNNYIPLWLLI